jgi:hypothetical protein
MHKPYYCYTQEVVLPQSSVFSPQDVDVLIREGQRFGSTYEILRLGVLTVETVVDWLKRQPVTINNLITYRHCLALFPSRTPDIGNEYSYIYRLHNGQDINIDDPLERLYLLIAGKVVPTSPLELDIVARARSMEIPGCNEDVLLDYDYFTSTMSTKKIRRRINYLRHNTRYYWNFVGKKLYIR